jgi:hypothetical protein
MKTFIDDLIQTIRSGNLNRLMTYFVPRFIIAGLILLGLTFLGPMGILIALAVIAFFVYRYFVR